ncbi:DoxX family protein [Nocardia asteroides]|uniref:DoxX family protein n=1 Tax=Nocardia asteroides TaxID=1824 RepID=UPI001E39801C|nr:DoxX family protein [Nocardia asteroides]UGT57096.1 DoxX family protein [Nocardia asteroides]
MFLAVIITSVLLAVAFVGAAIPKLTGAQQMRDTLSGLGVSPGLGRAIGVLEIVAPVGLIAGLWLPWVGAAAALGSALLMAGAVGYHIKAGDDAKHTAGPVVLGALALAVLVLQLVIL